MNRTPEHGRRQPPPSDDHPDDRVRPGDSEGEIHAFTRLVLARDAGDFREAELRRKELRRRWGWSMLQTKCSVVTPPGKRGGA